MVPSVHRLQATECAIDALIEQRKHYAREAMNEILTVFRKYDPSVRGIVFSRTLDDPDGFYPALLRGASVSDLHDEQCFVKNVGKLPKLPFSPCEVVDMLSHLASAWSVSSEGGEYEEGFEVIAEEAGTEFSIVAHGDADDVDAPAAMQFVPLGDHKGH